jgi:hypothetical protein
MAFANSRSAADSAEPSAPELIDEKGKTQLPPRPFGKAGHCAIEEVKISVKA